jgi:hypothetical protein
MGTRYSHLSLEERCRLRGMMEMGLTDPGTRQPVGIEEVRVGPVRKLPEAALGEEVVATGPDRITANDRCPPSSGIATSHPFNKSGLV